MSTARCEVCESEVAATGIVCPKCGKSRPLPLQREASYVAIASLFVGVAFCIGNLTAGWEWLSYTLIAACAIGLGRAMARWRL